MTGSMINRRTSANAPRILVVGGGLAGMATAVGLESAGLAVTLVEARKRLGGRASSFDDPATGEELDNSQHVLLGCCTNLIDFYRRLGVLDRIRFERTIHFIDDGGRRHDLWGTSGLPAPLHLAGSMASFGVLTWEEKARVVRAMVAMMRLGREGREALGDVLFGQWLDEHGQSENLVRLFYDPLLIGSLNEESRRVSAKYAIQVFQDAMLANERGYVLGLPACPLGRLYEKLPCGDVRLSTRVEELRFDGSRAVGAKLATGEVIDADAVVLATNHHAVSRWVPAELAAHDARFAHLDKLESIPILGAHLWFDRPVLRESHAALLSGPLQWLFRRDETGQSIRGVISAAREWTGVEREECLRTFEMQVCQTLPLAREAKLVRGVIVTEKRATFAPVPGVDRYRPAQGPPRGGVRDLVLAGDYTETGWPATMEGAVRSGYRAAEAVLAQVRGGQRASIQAADLPLEWPARLMGGM